MNAGYPVVAAYLPCGCRYSVNNASARFAGYTRTCAVAEALRDMLLTAVMEHGHKPRHEDITTARAALYEHAGIKAGTP